MNLNDEIAKDCSFGHEKQDAVSGFCPKTKNTKGEKAVNKKARSFALATFLLVMILSCQTETKEAWQKINKPAAKEIARQFENPPVEYSLSFYWGWDGNITEEVIARDLDEYKSKNVQIVTLEPGYNMPSPYLSPGWFAKVDTAVRLAKERDMRIYLVDEGKYPSGFAGGKITEEAPELRMKALVLDTIIEVRGGENVSQTLLSEIISAAAYNKIDSTTLVLEINNGKINWTAPEGDWQILLAKHAYQTSPTRSVNNPARVKDRRHSLCDYLDADATKKFIEFTHEVYKKHLAEEFGKTILGFRGDEPDYSIRGIPWTPDIFFEFEKRKAYDVRPYVASFFASCQTEKQARVKADYWDVWSSMFADNFFKVQADWCAGNGLEYLVHLNHEDKMVDLVRSEGDFFKAMRPVQMPGVDAIWHQIWPGEEIPVFPKYASSVAHLNGHPRAFTESFAAYNPHPDIKQAKWIIDEQLVRGINMVEIMFVPASSREQSGMRGWLADEKFPDVAKYIHRACFLLSQGLPATELAVYYPATSIWLGNKEAEKSALKIMQELLDMQRDFDVVDEQSIDSLLKLKDGNFVNMSGQAYSTVLIPPVSVISQKALTRLEKFKNSGGQVIFLGSGPRMVLDHSFFDANGPADISWATQEPSGELTGKVLEALPQPDFILDHPSASVKYAHRSWKDAELYFVFNESDQAQNQTVTLAGKGLAQFWDAMNGQIKNVNSMVKDKHKIEIELALEPWETRFIIIGGKAEL